MIITRGDIAQGIILDPKLFAAVPSTPQQLAIQINPKIAQPPEIAMLGNLIGPIVHAGISYHPAAYTCAQIKLAMVPQIWFNTVEKVFDMNTSWLSYVVDPKIENIWQLGNHDDVFPFYRLTGSPQLNFPTELKSRVGMTISEGLKLGQYWHDHGGATIAIQQGIYAVQGIDPVIALTFSLSMKFTI